MHFTFFLSSSRDFTLYPPEGPMSVLPIFRETYFPVRAIGPARPGAGEGSRILRLYLWDDKTQMETSMGT